MRFDLKSEKILKLLRISANPKNYFSGNREIEIALNRIYFCIIFGFIFYAIKIYNYNSYYVIIEICFLTNEIRNIRTTLTFLVPAFFAQDYLHFSLM